MRKNLIALTLALMLTNAHAGLVDFQAGEGLSYQRVVVKIKSVETNRLTNLSSIDTLKSLLKPNGLKVESLFFPTTEKNSLLKTTQPDALAKKNGLDRYMSIELPSNKKGDIQFINTLMDKLSQQDQVELVYPEAESKNLALETTTIPDFSAQQYYFKAPNDKKEGYALGGLNVVAADNYPGGRGEGVNFITMELDPWFTENTNLPGNAYPDATSRKQDGTQYGAHDTASVGIMVAKNLGYGVVGAAYKANKIGYVETIKELAKLIPKYSKGDVIQVGMATAIPNGSANCTSASGCGVPLEYYQANYDVFKMATDKGIYVVEGSGNHTINLDHEFFAGKFNRAVRDPGTILVGAVCGENGKRAYFSSYGSAIDVSAWGCDDVVTTGYGDLYSEGKTNYTAIYNGTSAANPQIAGLVADLSGIAKKANINISPVVMRQLLQVTGTKINGDRDVGYYPNLKPAADYIVNFGK